MGGAAHKEDGLAPADAQCQNGVKIALEDVPKQARRMARYRAKMRDMSTGRIKLPPLSR